MIFFFLALLAKYPRWTIFKENEQKNPSKPAYAPSCHFAISVVSVLKSTKNLETIGKRRNCSTYQKAVKINLTQNVAKNEREVKADFCSWKICSLGLQCWLEHALIVKIQKSCSSLWLFHRLHLVSLSESSSANVAVLGLYSSVPHIVKLDVTRCYLERTRGNWFIYF